MLVCPLWPLTSDPWHQQAIFLYTNAARWIFSLFATDLCEPCRRLRCCESPAGQQVEKHSDLQPTTTFTTYRVTSILFLSHSDDRFELWGHRLHHVHEPEWVAATWLADWLFTCFCILPEKCPRTSVGSPWFASPAGWSPLYVYLRVFALPCSPRSCRFVCVHILNPPSAVQQECEEKLLSKVTTRHNVPPALMKAVWLDY